MTLLLFAITFTIGISALCSALEAMVLSTTVAEIEALKKTCPKRGALMERFKEEIQETSSAILSLNTIANTFGSITCGALASQLLGSDSFWGFGVWMTLGILFFAEIIPKNVGVLHRKALHPFLIHVLWLVRITMAPISFVCKHALRFALRKERDDNQWDEEIILLADKSAQDGTLTTSERDMILNALSLDKLHIEDILTPRTVVFALNKDLTLSEVFDKESSTLPFARIPVYDTNIDTIVGVIRRRDLLGARSSQPEATVEAFMQPPLFIPDQATGASALEQFLKTHQQLAVVVDEFGSTMGVVTMEDLFEHLLGKEIFEKDDLAVDMRELARRKHADHA